MKKLSISIFSIILLLAIAGLILLRTTQADENISAPASPSGLDVKAELSNVSISKKLSGSTDKYVERIEADLVIHNNSSKTIGLDPNNCDYKVYINDQKLAGYDACTAIGGVISLEPATNMKIKVHPYPLKAKTGDSVYIEYGYMILLPEARGNGYSYDYHGSSYVKSNTTIVE